MDEGVSPGRALKMLEAIPFVLYGLAILSGLIFRSWTVGGIAVAAVAIVLWLEEKFGILTIMALKSIMLVLRMMFWLGDRKPRSE